MYRITIQTLTDNEHTIYFPGSEEYTVTSAVLSLSVGNAGTFEFTMPFSNPLYNEIVDHSIITVYEDNLEIWRGDIQDIKQNFDKSLDVYCLEDLAWLSEEAVAMTAITNETYLQRFTGAIASYNANQVAKRQFTQGVLTSVTTTHTCNWLPKYEENLLDCLRNYIADDGYVRIRRVIEHGSLVRYVDIVRLADFGQQADQTIEFGSNLLDFVKEMDNTNFLNVIYPYGKETETELYGDVMQRIVGTPIQNDASIAVYGRRARSVIFETESEAKLNSLALAYLNRYSQPILKIQVKAVDLGNIELVNRIHLGDSVRIIANTFAIDQWDYVTKQDLDLLDIANNQITLSDSIRTRSLTSQVAEQATEIKDIRSPLSVLDEAKKNAMSILQGENGGIVTFEVNGQEQIVGILIANNLDIEQATKAWGWNINGLCYVHRDYPTDNWTLGIAMTMNGEIVADYITTGEMSADRINGGHIRASLITALNDGTTVGNGDTTLSDFATKASTIVDVDVEYAKNQSSSTAPSTGWSTTSPQWEEGYYIWQRTKTTDGNNQASYSTPVCIQGAKGEDGQPGTSGVGVSAIVEQYYLSTSSTSPTGGSWSTAQPAWVEGKYIWTRSAVTWTTGSTTYTDPVLAKAINGANQSVKDLDNDLDQDELVGRITNFSNQEGIYLLNGHVYLNASKINTGELSANRISGGVLKLGGINETVLDVYDENNNYIGGIYEDKWYIKKIILYEGEQFINWANVLLYEKTFNLQNVSSNLKSYFRYNPYRAGQSEDEPTDAFRFQFILYDANDDPMYYYYDQIGYCRLYRHYPSDSGQGTMFNDVETYAAHSESNFSSYAASADHIEANVGINDKEDNYRFEYELYRQQLYSDGVRKVKIKFWYTGFPVQLTSEFVFANHRGTFKGIADIYDNKYYTMVDSNNSEFNAYSSNEYYINMSGLEITKHAYQESDKVVRWQTSSDERLKENIDELDAELSKKIIEAAETKQFKYKGEKGIHYGMIAQDVRKTLDDLGETDAKLEFSQGEMNGLDDQRAINYEEYIPHLINYVKQQQKEIEELKNLLKEEN